jgi:hypothetical protein
MPTSTPAPSEANFEQLQPSTTPSSPDVGPEAWPCSFDLQYNEAFDNFPSPAEADPLFTNNNYYYQYPTDRSYTASITNMRPHNPAFDAAAFDSSLGRAGNDTVNAPVVYPFADGPSASDVVEVGDLTIESPPRPAAAPAGSGSHVFFPPSKQSSVPAAHGAQLAPPPTPAATGPTFITPIPQSSSISSTSLTTPVLTPRTMGYPMQKNCMVKCGLPLKGLLSWTDLSHSQQEAAIDRLLLLDKIPPTSRSSLRTIYRGRWGSTRMRSIGRGNGRLQRLRKLMRELQRTVLWRLPRGSRL